MFKFSLPLIALAAFAAACSASAQNMASVEQIAVEPETLNAAPPLAAHFEQAAYDDAAITCDVRSRRTANGIVIQARAFADRDIDGEYDLLITKTDRAGTSEISSGGPLSLVAGSAATLGENEFSIERGARLRAVLTLRDASGELCRQTFRL